MRTKFSGRVEHTAYMKKKKIEERR